MKIAIFSDCYLDLTGGIVSSINAQKKALEDNGHEVYVSSSGYRRSDKELDKLAKEHVFVVPSCRWLIRGVTPIARRPGIIEKWLLREHPELRDFDLFYVHYEAGCSIAGLRLAKKHNIPSLQVMHGREDMGVTSLIPFGFRTLVAFLLNLSHSLYIAHPIKVRKDDYLANTIAKAKMWTMMVNHANYADYVLTPSEHFRKKLQHYGVSQKFFLMPNGFPDDKMPSSVNIRKLENGEPLRIIWHSRVSGEKRIMVLLAALAKVHDKYQMEVYGDGSDFARAKKYASRHKLNVKFYGNASFEKVRKAIERAHLGILTSYNFDNYPMTLVEDEATGLPVLICDPDMREILPEGGYVLCKNETVDGIAEAINELISNPEKISTMSQVMIEHRDEVTMSKRIKTLEKIISDINK